MNRKTAIIGAAVALLLVGGGVFYSLTNEANQTFTVDEVVAMLQASDVKLGEETEVYYQLVGAVDGIKLGSGYANGLGIYQFSDIAKAKEVVERFNAPSGTYFFKNNILVLVYNADKAFISDVRAAIQ